MITCRIRYNFTIMFKHQYDITADKVPFMFYGLKRHQAKQGKAASRY
jgi:hypothetical protein